MSKPDDKYVEMEVAFIDDWVKQGKSVKDLTYADAIKFSYEHAQKNYEPLTVDEAAVKSAKEELNDPTFSQLGIYRSGFKAGVLWSVNQKNNPWIDCSKAMPPEVKCKSSNMQGCHEWTESKPVLAYDSAYRCLIDSTRNGKWRSESQGGYQGQICHGIIAWMPIPDYAEPELEVKEKKDVHLSVGNKLKMEQTFGEI